MKLKRSAGKLSCTVCGNMKRRKHLVIYNEKDYNFELESVQKAFLTDEVKTNSRVKYVCSNCYITLKNMKTMSVNSISASTFLEKDFSYTCCHKIFENRKNVVLFTRKNYDLSSNPGKAVLNKEFRCKRSLLEYICKECHSCLQIGKSRTPTIPPNAYCLKNNNLGNGQCVNGIINWNRMLQSMNACINFQELESCVRSLDIPDVTCEFKGLRQMRNDKRDATAFFLIPDDVGVRKENIFPVHTTGDGSCFYYALSRLVYGDECHCVEMRVCIITEGVKNMNLYLNHDYLCRGLDFPHWSADECASIYATYCSFYRAGMSLDHDSVVKYYKKEMLNLTNFGEYSGIWQFHQAANVLGCCVQSVYPHIPIQTLRQDMNRVILPMNLDGPNISKLLRIMWTKSNIACFGHNHFVSLVEVDETMPFVDVNLIPIGYSDDSSKNVPIEIDLTKDSNKEKVSGKQDVSIEIDITQDSNEDSIEKSDRWLCTSCHKVVSSRSNLYLFDKSRYNFDHDIVKNVLDEKFRLCDKNGNEFICRFCHKNLRSWDNPKYPMKSVYLAQSKNQGSVVLNGDEIKSEKKKNQTEARNRKTIEFEVKKEMKAKIKKEIHEGEKVSKKKSKRDILVDRAGAKFRASCKEFPEFVCTCCHRMLFLRSVKIFHEDKYNFGGVCGKALNERYRFKDEGKQHEYICTTCNRSMKKNRMPCQAVANGLEIPTVPKQLQGLTRLECRCIGLRIPFMWIRALPKGGQGKIRGPCINVPASLEPIAHVLPRIPENIDLVLLKFKRMLTYKSNYMCDYIRPEKVMNALRWLKNNNPHYYHVEIDENWMKKLECDSMFPHISEGRCGEENLEKSDRRNDTINNIQQKVCRNGDNNNDSDAGGAAVAGDDRDNSDDDDEGNKSEEDEANVKEAQKEYDRRAEIRVGESSTCMQIEDLDEAVFSIAPGQNSIPKYILMDDDFEVLSFPDFFPGGFGGFEVKDPRDEDLKLRRYINQRLLNKDARFSQNSEYIFAFQYATEIKQLQGAMNIALKRRNTEGRRVNAGDLRNFNSVNQLIWKDIAYKFMKQVRGTPAYWQQQLMDTLAMLRTFGTPTWFLSLSPAEFLWPEMTQAVGKKMFIDWTEDDVMAMDWQTKAKHFRDNPLPIDQMFHKRLESFFTDFLLSEAHPLGEISEHVEKIEFQARGSPHAHCLIWVKDAPKVDEQSDDEVCQFVDRYIHGKIPCDSEGNSDIHGLVKKLQGHAHSPYCRPHVNAKCRFNFPRPPTTKTIIARNKIDMCDGSIDEKIRRHVMQLVHERIEEDNGSVLKEILENENIPEEVYLDCLRASSHRGTNVILERDISDTKTNNYNADCLKLWRANMDLQYVADPYACIMYVLSYVLKCENGMSEILKRTAKEFKDETVRKQMGKVLSTFANKREVSIHEAIHRVTSLWLFRKSRTVVHINNAPKAERHRMPKSNFELADLDDDDEDVFQICIHDRYAVRPDDLEEMCLATFVAEYDVAPQDASGKNIIELKDPKMGKMRKRGRTAVIRTHRFNDDTFKYYYSKLLLFLPWRNEDELIAGYEMYQDHYNDVVRIVEENAVSFNLNSNLIDEALEEYQKNPPKVSEWLEAGCGQEDIAEKDFSEQGNGDDGGAGGGGAVHGDPIEEESALSLKYRIEGRKDIISNEEYCIMMRSLNKEQREIVTFNRIWMKESMCKMNKGEHPQSYHIFLSGPGGTGKSHVIKMIYRDNVKFFRRFFVGKPSEFGGVESSVEDVIAILCAYTGTAAFNIDGMTLHSAFQLFANNISDERKTTMKTRLHRLQHITIDEVSMVGTRHFNQVNQRCAMIKYKNPNDQNFGNINVLAVGDFYQLAPVMQKQLFMRDYYNSRCPQDLAPLLWDKFLFHELTQVMRQKDQAFADMLNVVRVSKPEENSDVDRMLKARELNVTENDPAYPNDVLHVYANNENCNIRNEKMLNRLNGPVYIIKAEDSLPSVKVNMSQVDLTRLATNKTGNLTHTLLLKVGARVFLSTNVDVGDGLTNGVFGTVTGIITSRQLCENGDTFEEVRVVLVRFDSDRVGKEARAKSLYKRVDPSAVPISKSEVSFRTKRTDNDNTVNVIRKQFPLVLSWAVTIHKVQGMTMDCIVVDMAMEKGRYMNGQAYVALSRVRTYDGLHIINYNRHQIRVSRQVKKEMEHLRKEKRLPPIAKPLIWSIPDDCIKMVHLNVQGLATKSRTKKMDLNCDLEIQNVDIVCLTETHYGSDNCVSAKDIWTSRKGCIYRKDRIGSKGGGVLIAVDEKFTSRKIASNSDLEAIAVDVYCPNKVVIICMYISPSLSKNGVTEEIRKFLNDVTYNTDKVIVVGDFNEDLLEGQDGKVICDSFFRIGFKQHVSKPTTDYGSILDHVYSRRINDIVVDIADTYYSDHDRVFCFFEKV